MKIRVVLLVLCSIACYVGSAKSVENPNYEYAEYRNDTIPFVPDTSGGWGLYASYLKNEGDSVVFELILSHTTLDIIDWSQSIPFGVISSAYTPLLETSIEYKEPNRTWFISVRPNGKCYLKLLAGPIPDGNPCIIPFQTKYKK